MKGGLRLIEIWFHLNQFRCLAILYSLESFRYQNKIKNVSRFSPFRGEAHRLCLLMSKGI